MQAVVTLVIRTVAVVIGVRNKSTSNIVAFTRADTVSSVGAVSGVGNADWKALIKKSQRLSLLTRSFDLFPTLNKTCTSPEFSQ